MTEDDGTPWAAIVRAALWAVLAGVSILVAGNVAIWLVDLWARSQ